MDFSRSGIVVSVASMAALFAPMPVAAEQSTPHPELSVQLRGQEGPEFHFSEAHATSESPVVITVLGRKMKRSDSEYRTSLQEYWISEHASDDMQVVMREQVECAYRADTEPPRCDRYELQGGGKTLEFYFYLNNWR